MKRVRQLDPRSPSVPYQIAVMYSLMRRYPEAAQACEESIRLAAQPTESYFLMGIVELEEGRFPAAAKNLRYGLGQKPNNPWYHAVLGVTLFEMGDFAASKAELDRSLRIDAKIQPAYFWRARVLERLREPKEAIADLQTYTTLRPDFGRGYSELQRLYAAQGASAKAVKMRDEALKAEVGKTQPEPSFLDFLLIKRIHENLRQLE